MFKDEDGHDWFRTPKGKIFVAFWTKIKFKGEKKKRAIPWGCGRSVMQAQCKAFDLGYDLKALGFDELPEAE